LTTPTGARSVRPTDLVALVSYDGEVYPNEALSWERFAKGETGPHPLESAIEQWFSFATGRNTWISVKGQGIRGMLSARKRGGGIAWEVECLILTEDDPSLLASLVERMTADAMKSGTRRVYLRLREDSRILPIVREAGFLAARRETLWGAASPKAASVADPPLRPKTKEDAFALFGLYNSAVPQPVRALEATDLQEWSAFAETRGFGSKAEEFVREEDGRISASLRVARGRSVGWIELLTRPENQWLDALVAAGVRRAGGKRRVYALAPDYAGGLAPVLADAGFTQVATTVTFVRRIAVPVAEPELAAAPQSVLAV
jgi:hypothetical protein